ncbi:DUF2490 domain-containing protein [Tenacibaculum sp. 1B UA]|uniref:DUF2490 domain-containing protein n=1 Tax=Tenacibaculum sp. 1B UA TaxID=2922252 RepID=UPI002A245C9B|nr:DUF2490 domain-containing protein [Tenacibaculum sp. 1B UA]MDX8553558.1 DUF2490 domain-containing protein [Tenacibaculum sp. 1B UA]
MRKTLIVVLVFTFFSANAQKVDQFNSWWYYSGKYRLTEKFNIETLYSWSRHNFVKNWQQSKLRLGGSYDYLKNVSFGVGYEWVVLFPYGAHPVSEKRTEHRVYEYFNLKNKIKTVAVNYGMLLEQRIMKDRIRHRLRLILGVKVPLIQTEGKTKLGLSLSNQVFLDIDKYANNNHFGQNRIYGAFNIPINNTFTLSLGYMNQYIIIKDNRIENDHTLMVKLSHKIDFRKKKKRFTL